MGPLPAELTSQTIDDERRHITGRKEHPRPEEHEEHDRGRRQSGEYDGMTYVTQVRRRTRPPGSRACRTVRSDPADDRIEADCIEADCIEVHRVGWRGGVHDRASLNVNGPGTVDTRWDPLRSVRTR